MRLNAAGTKLALKKKKPVAAAKQWATCGDELAAAFTASKRYNGRFYPDGFSLGEDGFMYDPFDREAEEKAEDAGTCDVYIEFNSFADNCGIVIVSHLDEIPAEPAIQAAIMRTVACAARKANFGMLFASVNDKQKQSRAMLEAFGMTRLFDTHNPNSGNDITVYGKDITGNKDVLGISDGGESMRGWLREY